MSEVKVNKISPRSGTDVTLGDSGDTITVPTGVTLDASNATTTLPANVVTTDGTQTLTNKSIDASQLTGTITPSDNTVSLAKLTATGTKDSTTFLRGDNTFAEAGGGAFTFLARTVVSTAVSEVEFDNFINTSLYDNYMIQFNGAKPVSADQNLQIQEFVSGSYRTSNYSVHIAKVRTNSNTYDARNGEVESGFYLNNAQEETGTYAGNGTAFLYDLANSGRYTMCTVNSFYRRGIDNKWYTSFGGGVSSGTGEATKIRINYTAGNIAQGEFALYGVNKS